MPTFDQIREAFPGAKDLSDEDILQRISDATELPLHQVANDFGYDKGRGGKNAKRLGASVDNYQANLYGLGEAIAVPGSGLHEFMRSGRQDNEIQANVASGRARDMGAIDSFSDVHGLGDFGNYAAGLGIQSLPYLGEAAAGALTGGLGAAGLGLRGATAINAMRVGGAVAASYPSSVGDILQGQREQSGGETDLLSAAALGVPYAASNAFGVEGSLARGSLFRSGIKALDKVKGVKGALARGGVAAGETALGEGANETFQEGMNQFGRMAVDPDATFFNPESNQRFLESGIGGATLGGIMGGVGGMRRSRSHTNIPANLLPDATPQSETSYNPPDSLTNTSPTQMPGFSSQQTDPLAGILNPGSQQPGSVPPVGPSVTINPQAPMAPVASGTVAANPAGNSPTNSRGKQKLDEPPVTPQEREEAAGLYRVENVLDDGSEEGHWRAFGKDYFKRGELNKALDKQAQEDRGDDPAMTVLAKELNKGSTPMRPKALKELASSLVGSTPEKTAYNLNAAIAGEHKESDRLAATYEALTGKVSPAWEKLQEPAPAKEKPAPKTEAKPAAVATQPTTFADDDFEGMARATLMKLMNGNEANVDIALADLRGEKPAKIQADYGVSDSQVRKIRARMAPKALEVAARQAGVPLEKLQAALARKETAAVVEEPVSGEGSTSRGITDSDTRPLSTKTDEELTEGQQESDVYATAGMSVNTGTGASIADASTRNNSRAKLEAVGGKLSHKSITPADLNNLYIQAAEADDRKTAHDIENELLRRHKAGELSAKDMEDLGEAQEEGKATVAAEQKAVVKEEKKEAPKAPPVAKAAPVKKEPKGKIGTAWDKVVRDVAKAKVEVPAWDSLSPEQKTKATDKVALNGKLTLHDIQSIVAGKPVVQPKPVAAPAPAPAAPKIDEKSAATVAKVQRSKVASTKEKTGSDFMSKLNEAAAAKKAAAAEKTEAKPIVDKSEGMTAAESTRESVSQNWPEEPINPKVRKLVDALNDAGIYTELSGDMYGDDLVYVDLGAPMAQMKGVKLPVGWTTTHPSVAHAYVAAGQTEQMDDHFKLQLNGDYSQKNLNKLFAGAIKRLNAHPDSLIAMGVRGEITRLVRAGGAVSAEEAQKVAQAVAAHLAKKDAAPEGDFAQSKIRDTAGKLLTLWHGSPSTTVEEALHGKKKFSQFDKTKLGSNTGAQSAKMGFFFTDSLKNAGHYGGGGGMGNLASIIEDIDYFRQRIADLKDSILTYQLASYKKALANRLETVNRSIAENHLVPVNLNMTNPFVYDFEGKSYREESFASLLQKAKDAGHDGAIFQNVDDPINNTVYVVFEPEQIRTVDNVTIDQAAGTGVPKGWGGVDASPREAAPARPYATPQVELDQDDKPIAYSWVTDHAAFFDSLPHLQLLRRIMQAEGIYHIMEGLDGLGIAESDRTRFGSRGVYSRYPDGKRFVDIAADTLESVSQAPFVLLHELGHAADLVGQLNADALGVFSSHPLFHMKLEEDKTITAVGGVAKELQQLFKSNQNWKFLQYPFNYRNLTIGSVHRELFAQVFAAFIINPEMVKTDAPLTFAVLKKALSEIRQTNYSEALARTKERAKAGGAQQRSGFDDGRDRASVEHVQAPEGAPEIPGGRTQGGRTGGAQASRQAERFVEALPQASRTGARRLYTTITDAAKKGMYGAAFTWDLADLAKSKLPSVNNYMHLMGKKAAVKTHLEDQVEKVLAASERVAKVDRLGRHQTGTGEHSINKFLFDSTMQGKWGYKEDPNSLVRLDPEMAERFENFSDDAQELIKVIFKHGAAVLRMKQRIIKDEINNEYRALVRDAGADPDKVTGLENKRRAALQHYDSLLFLTANKPYAPLRRFGNYVTVARSQQYRDAVANNDNRAIERLQSDERHYFVSFYETLGEAEEHANRLRATGQYTDVSHFEKEKGLSAIHNGRDMLTAFQRLRNLIQSELANDPADQAAKSLNGMISDLYLQTLAETSARKAELKRRNVAGADKDMLRAFATQGRADAHFIAALKHNGDVTESMYEMRREAHEAGEDKAGRMRLFNEFMTRHALHMNYNETRVQDAVMRGTSLWMLATSPSYYLQNATQTPMIALPYMAGKHGYGRSWSTVTQAYKDLGPMSEGLSFSDRMDFTKAPADVQRMLQDLVAGGRIDIALDQDLGRFQSRADNSVSHAWNAIDRKLRGMQQRVEAINRVTTAVAAYRMELARNGGNHAAATEYADKTIRITHGDYSATNTPRYLTPGGGLPAAKVITQFRKFQIIQASLIVRLFNNAFGDVSPEERATARKALAFTLGHTVVMGGAYALPGASILAWLVAKMLSDPDEPDDDELTFRRMIGNEEVADLVLKGAPAYFGLDLSGKLGMGNAFSVIPYARVNGVDKDSYTNALLGLSGPFVGGLLPKAAEGVNQIGRGNWYKGMEMLLPNGFANAMKAYRFQDEGVTRKSGDVVMDADEISFATTVLQAMGLQTKQLTDRTFDQKVVTEFEEFYKDKTNRLTEKYARAHRKGDTAGMQEAREQWMQMQEARVRNGFTRQPLSTLLKAPINQAKRERKVTNHTGAGKQSRRLAHELDGI